MDDIVEALDRVREFMKWSHRYLKQNLSAKKRCDEANKILDRAKAKIQSLRRENEALREKYDAAVKDWRDVLSIPTARREMREAFEKDMSIDSGGFYSAYHANVACILMDEFGIMDPLRRNDVAEKILRRIFWD